MSCRAAEVFDVKAVLVGQWRRGFVTAAKSLTARQKSRIVAVARQNFLRRQVAEFIDGAGIGTRSRNGVRLAMMASAASIIASLP